MPKRPIPKLDAGVRARITHNTHTPQTDDASVLLHLADLIEYLIEIVGDDHDLNEGDEMVMVMTPESL